MKLSDVITQLVVLLPTFTEKFTDTVQVSELTRSGATTKMTAKCLDQHHVETGDAVCILNAEMHIAVSSLTRVGIVGTVVTATDHDFTNAIAPEITISGADDVEFNGTFKRINVVNRRTITFQMADSGPTSSANGVLENAESALRQYDGTYKVTSVPNTTEFTFDHPTTSLADPTGDAIVARVKPRISGAIDITRAIAAYTKQALGKYYLVGVVGDVSASQSRQIHSDAVDNFQRGTFLRQQLIQNLSLFVIIPVSQEIAARQSRDDAEELFRAITRSLVNSSFDSYLHVGKQGPIQFIRHGVFDYNTSVYVHEYAFQQIVDLVFEDSVGFDLDVAFREIDFNINPDLPGSTDEVLSSTVDLDDEPLP